MDIQTQIDSWKQEIDQITYELIENFASLSDNKINTKPYPNSWSIGQIIDHLIKINSSYFPVLEEARSGKHRTPFIAKIGFMVNYIGKIVLKAVQPKTEKKMVTFPIWEPAETEYTSEIFQRFRDNQEQVKKEIEACADLLEKGTVISSPANRNVVYKVEKAFEIIIAHEKRHLQQILNIAERL